MGSKLKRLRREGLRQRVDVVAERVLMLRAARQFMSDERDAALIGQSHVIVICDVRDELGAGWAAMVQDMEIEELRQSVLKAPDGRDNPHPFVGFWSPRRNLLEFLRGIGARVPAEWVEQLKSPPEPGHFWLLLKGRGADALIQSNLEQVEALNANAVDLG